MFSDSPDLKIGTEIEILGRYLYCNNWNVDDALKNIHDYYDFKNKYPDWITNDQTPDDFEEIYNLNTRILLPHTDKQGKFIVVHKIVDAFNDIENYNIKLVQLDDLIYESVLSSPRGQQYGITTILDTEGINRNYIKYYTPSIATLIGKKCDIMPIRLEDKRAHFLIKNALISSLLSLILPFLGCLKKLAIFHKSSNLEKLKEYIGKENLPYEYGGSQMNSFDSSYLKEFLRARYSYVKQSQKYYKKDTD
ncbi:clavesin-1 [Condylostylus longicornis]|uniref:clavesin-1 n=1 Tax=Condylostylus longicornis TaxID=2530218 RepID=UPI00244DA72A|nr:clavesin-1 [Condylostylus longicornis]